MSELMKTGMIKHILKLAWRHGLGIATGFLYLFALLGGYAGWINPERWALPAMLALIFVPLFVLAVGAVVGWNVYSHKCPMAIAGDCVFLLLVYPFFLVFPLGSIKLKNNGETTFTVLSYNSFYCNDMEFENPVRSRTLDYIITENPDIVCLQELYSLDAAGTHGKATETQIDLVKQLYPYRLEPGSRELVILSKYPMTFLSGNTGELFFQYEMSRVDVQGTPVTVVNVHLPSFGLSDEERQVINDLRGGAKGISHAGSERSTIYGKLANAFAVRAEAAKIIRNIADTVRGDLIVCGDFNDVPGSYAYRVVRGSDMHDVYAETYSGYTNTFHAYMMYFHIDHMLYRGNMRALRFVRGNVRSSDHYPVIGTFAIPESE